MEEGGPVYVVCELAQRLGFDSASPGKFGDRWVVVFPVYRDPVITSLSDGESCLLFASVKFLSSFLMVFLVGVDENLAAFGQKGGCDGDRSRSVEDVNKWATLNKLYSLPVAVQEKVMSHYLKSQLKYDVAKAGGA